MREPLYQQRLPARDAAARIQVRRVVDELSLKMAALGALLE
jgi:hypothetical protein